MIEKDEFLEFTEHQKKRSFLKSMHHSGVDWIKGFVAVSSVISLGFICYVLAFIDLPKENKDMFNLLIGVMLGTFSSLVGYYFGGVKSIRNNTNSTPPPET